MGSYIDIPLIVVTLMQWYIDSAATENIISDIGAFKGFLLDGAANVSLISCMYIYGNEIWSN